MAIDFVHGGQASGSVAARLLNMPRPDINVLRPYIGNNGRTYVDRWVGINPKTGKAQYTPERVHNTEAFLRKEEWVMMDQVVERVARSSLRFVGDVKGAGLVRTIPDGMGVTVVQYQTETDWGSATLSMNGLRQTNRDRPTRDIKGTPLPIGHADWSFDLRDLMVSRRMGVGLDMSGLEQETRRLMEQTEKLYLGVLDSYSFAGYSVYGVRNTPARVAYSLTLPTDSAWSPQLHFREVLGMVQALKDINFDGPYGLYYSRGWWQYLGDDYSETYNRGSSFNRILELPDIGFLRTANYLPDFEVVLIQFTQNVIRSLDGMQPRLVQWDSHGGLQLNWKLMQIDVPELRSNADGDTGIVHGVAS